MSEKGVTTQLQAHEGEQVKATSGMAASPLALSQMQYNQLQMMSLDFSKSVLPVPASPGLQNFNPNAVSDASSLSPSPTKNIQPGSGLRGGSSARAKNNRILIKPLSDFSPKKLQQNLADLDERNGGHQNSVAAAFDSKFMPDSFDAKNILPKNLYVEEVRIGSNEKTSFGQKIAHGNAQVTSLSKIEEEAEQLNVCDHSDHTKSVVANKEPAVTVQPLPNPQANPPRYEDTVKDQQMELIVQIVNQLGYKGRQEIANMMQNMDTNISQASFDRRVIDCLRDLVKRGELDPDASRGQVDKMLLTMTDVVSMQKSAVVHCINFREMASAIQVLLLQEKGSAKKISKADLYKPVSSPTSSEDKSMRDAKDIQNSYIIPVFRFSAELPSWLQKAESSLINYIHVYSGESGLYSKVSMQTIVQKLGARVDDVSAAARHFNFPHLVDNNYKRRDRLLYTPRVQIPVTGPRHNVVYFYKEYRELRPAADYEYSRLFKPIEELVQKEPRAFGEKGAQKATGLSKVELSVEMYIDLQTSMAVAGFEMVFQGFEQEMLLKRYKNSFNDLEEKTRIQKVSSMFAEKFIRQCLVPTSFLNLDLGMHLVTLLSLEAILKLHCNLLLYFTKQVVLSVFNCQPGESQIDRSELLTQIKCSKYRDFIIQLLIIEVRFLIILAKEFYTAWLHPRVIGKKSQTRIFLLKGIKERLGEHLNSACCPIDLEDIDLDAEDPEVQVNLNQEDEDELHGKALKSNKRVDVIGMIVRVNFGVLNELESYLLNTLKL